MAEIYRVIELGFAVVFGLNRALRISLTRTHKPRADSCETGVDAGLMADWCYSDVLLGVVLAVLVPRG